MHAPLAGHLNNCPGDRIDDFTNTRDEITPAAYLFLDNGIAVFLVGIDDAFDLSLQLARCF